MAGRLDQRTRDLPALREGLSHHIPASMNQHIEREEFQARGTAAEMIDFMKAHGLEGV